MPKMIFHSFIYHVVLYPGFLAMEQIDLGAVNCTENTVTIVLDEVNT